MSAAFARVLLALCSLGAVAGSGAAWGQTAGDAIPAALKAATALVQCSDGTHLTYRTGFVVGTDDVESFVETKNVGGAATCHAPLVTFTVDPAHAYAGHVMPRVTTPGMSFTMAPDLLLAVDRPVASVVHFSSQPITTAQRYLLVGFPVTVMSTDKPTTLVAISGSPTFIDDGITRIAEIDADPVMDFAIVIDPASGDVVGSAEAYRAVFRFGKPPATDYSVRAVPSIMELLHAFGVAPGITHATGPALQAERLLEMARHVTFPVFEDGNERDLAIVLGSTATNTVLVSVLYHPSGAHFVAALDRDGSPHIESASVIGIDPKTRLAFLSIPKLDVLAPSFAAPPATGAQLAIPFIFGSCAWDRLSAGTDGCRLSMASSSVASTATQRAGTIGFLPGNTVEESWPGSPVFDPSSGAIVAIAINSYLGAIPMTAVAQRASAFGLGISLEVKP